MAWDIKPEELPVRLNVNDGTAENFNNAVSKARMMYDTVEANHEFQCAILYDTESNRGHERNKKQFTMMYTSPLDKEIKTVQVEHENVTSINENNERYPNGFAKVTRIGFTKDVFGGTKKVTCYGLINHEGKEVMQAKYQDIKDIQGSFLYCQGLSLATSLSRSIYDYKGRLRLILDGDALDREKLTIDNEEVRVLITSSSETGGKSLYWVFAVYKGDLYSVFKFKFHGTYIRVWEDKNIVRISCNKELGAKESIIYDIEAAGFAKLMNFYEFGTKPEFYVMDEKGNWVIEKT